MLAPAQVMTQIDHPGITHTVLFRFFSVIDFFVH
jgi:hypothetical protein